MMQWYPGHMVKAKEEMRAKVALVDAVIVLLDARAPFSSLNPDLKSVIGAKATVFLLNKADLADPEETARWVKCLASEGIDAFPVESLAKPPLPAILKRVAKAAAPILEREKAKGMIKRPLKAMIAGIPNVGKSTLINRLAGKSVTRVANKPGVTIRTQWIRLNPELYLLDTPGVLWPRFTDPVTGTILGLIGSLKDQKNAEDVLSSFLVPFMMKYYPGRLHARYDILESGTTEEILNRLALKKGFVNPRDARKRASILMLTDFRNGRLGRITIDRISSGHVEQV